MRKRAARDCLLPGLAEMSGRGVAPRRMFEELPAMVRSCPGVADARLWLLERDPDRLESPANAGPSLPLAAGQADELAAIRDPLCLQGPGLDAAYLRASEPFRGWAADFHGLVPLGGRQGMVGVLILRLNRGAFSPRSPLAGAIRESAALLLPAFELERLRDREDRRYVRLFQLDRLLLLGEMAAAVVHDLRTPLATVLLQLHRMEGEAGAARQHAAAAIREKVAEIERGIGGLLDFARARDLRCTDVDLGLLVERTVALVPHGRIPAGTVIANEAASGARAWADPYRLQRVLLNLLFNALDAAGEGGRVTVSVARLPDRRLALFVRDDGPGIPERLRDEIFKPFVTTKESGTGLGLAICRSLMEEMGGAIGLEPGSGGATLRLELPEAGGR